MSTAHDILTNFPAGPLGAHLAIAGQGGPIGSGSDAERLSALEREFVGRRFLAEYAYHFDAKDAEGLLPLYADDCVLVNTNATFIGIDAIRAAQLDDIPKTEGSFHHFSNIMTSGGVDGSDLWVSAYMYNLAVREDQHYGTVGTFVASLRLDAERWRAASIRITIDSRHLLQPILMRPAPAPSHASAPENSFDLVGLRPRFPSLRET